MTKKAATPQLRFAGFDDAWEQRKLGETFDFTVSNNTLSRAELNYEYGEVKSVHYGDVLIKYGSVLDAQTDEIPFATGKSIMDFPGQLLQEGDIIIADTAEDEATGKAVEIRDLRAVPVVSGLHTIVCRPIIKMAPYYLGYYFNSGSYHNQLLPLMQGIKVLSLSRSNLLKTGIKYPKSQEEQKLIGSFFRSLDNLIALHQRKYDKLLNVKKSMLEKMFPKNGSNVPEIRFKGFTDAWEQRKLGEVAIITSGYMGNSMLSNGKYHLTRIETIADGKVDNERVGYSNEKPDDMYLLHKGDILYSNINSISHMGKVAEYEGNTELYHGINLLRLVPDSCMDSDFLLYLLNTNSCRNWAKTRANQAVSQASINQSLLATQEIAICSLNEQRQIGVFFRSLDNLITLHQRKLEKLKNLKKACLEKMFV